MTPAAQQNMALMSKLDIRNLDACASIFSDKFVWHYFNPKLPELEGDYQGVAGLKRFFAKLKETSTGSFQSVPVDARPAGDELVFTQARNRLTTGGETIELDAVVIWRIVDDKILEAWDIPSVYKVRTVSE